MDEHNANDDKKNAQDKPEHPPLHYSFNELYMIRKESIAHSNDLIIKRLHRCFARVKRFKAINKEKELNEPYEIDNCEVRRDFRRLHQMYKNGSKTNQVTQSKIEKMRRRVEKAKYEVSRDETILAKDVDLAKLYVKSREPPSQMGSSDKNLSGQKN